MDLSAHLCVLLIIVYVYTGAQAKNASASDELEKRWSFLPMWDAIERNSCTTRVSNNGFCISLRACPQLFNQVRHLNPGRVLQNLYEYTSPCVGRGFVCCPERRNIPWELGDDRTSEDSRWTTERPWTWSTGDRQLTPTSTTQRMTTGKPRKPTTPVFRPTSQPVPWLTTKKPKQDGKAGVGGTQTKHKNRRLLPEDNCGLILDNRVLGGTETNLEDHPWMALLRLRLLNGKTAFVCGGTLISSRYVLTAAHCMTGDGIPRGSVMDMARLGEHNVITTKDCTGRGQCSDNSQTQDIPVEERIIHQDFTPDNPATYNDIALLRLKYEPRFNMYVQPVCLPLDSLSRAQYDGKKLTVVGWGKTSNDNARNSPIKMQVTVPVVPLNQCARHYIARNIQLRDTQMCAGGEEGKDSCQGDSGGPLLIQEMSGAELKWFIQGVVSTGPKECGKAGRPAIYTRVSKYLTWILDNLKK